MSGLSIVIPTHGRHDLVEALLDSISADRKSVDFDVEIILVDDSPAAEADNIRRAASRYDALVLAGGPHVGVKRNDGAARARHAVILFLDSDVQIRPGTLRSHLARLSAAPVDVAGCLGKVAFVGQQTYAWKVIEAMQLTLPFSYPDVTDQVPWGPTANISFRREAFLQAGGFDASLPRYGGEDVDLGLRLSDRGQRIITAPDAVAEHTIKTWSTWRQNLPRLWNFGLADYHLLIRHPERSFFDFPNGPMLWSAQVLLLTGLVLLGCLSLPAALGVMGLSAAAYLAAYACLKQRHSQSGFHIHLPGPVVFWTMDLAKTVEAVRSKRLDLMFCRIKFLDDLIAQDWIEIAASAWGLSASAAAFLCGVIAGAT